MAGVTPGGRHHRRSRGQHPYPTDPQPTGPQRLPYQSPPRQNPQQGPQQPYGTNLHPNVAYMPVRAPVHRSPLQDTHLATPRNVGGQNVRPLRQPKPKVSRPVVIAAVAAGVAVGFVGGQILDGPDEQPAIAAVQTKTEARTVAAPASPTPAQVKLRDFTGLGAGEAMAWLTNRGWEIDDIAFSGDILDEADFWPLDWKVTAQNFPAGHSVKVGTKIVLTCTKI